MKDPCENTLARQIEREGKRWNLGVTFSADGWVMPGQQEVVYLHTAMGALSVRRSLRCTSHISGHRPFCNLLRDRLKRHERNYGVRDEKKRHLRSLKQELLQKRADSKNEMLGFDEKMTYARDIADIQKEVNVIEGRAHLNDAQENARAELVKAGNMSVTVNV